MYGPPPCPQPREIDVHHLGNPLVICCFEHDDVIVDPGPESSHHTLLEALDAPPERILLTHIHFDHAGATGALVRRWPDVEVWVHERGAPHLIDPSRLDRQRRAPLRRRHEAAVGRGRRRARGQPARPRAAARAIGPWRVEYTPGHASHHVSYLHEPTGTAFVGDVGGVRVDGGPIIPPTPPPDIDIELWHAVARDGRRLGARAPGRHPLRHLRGRRRAHRAMHEALDRWAALALETDQQSYAAAMVAEMERAPDATATQAFLQAMPPDTLWPGLDRYWSKKNR